MDYNDIFASYYSLYRNEAQIPNSQDDEYKIGIPLANEAINRWEHYDNTYWKELFIRAADSNAETSLKAGQSAYDLPDDFRELGGIIKVKDSDGRTRKRYPLVEPSDVQFRGDNTTYCFVTGNRSDGYQLNLSEAPTAELDGLTLDYWYYKQATRISDTGSGQTEMSDPYFVIHRMLANRFRGSRNPYYGSAKSDAEDILRMMQLDNNSGTWANPWSIPDRSGSVWGG